MRLLIADEQPLLRDMLAVYLNQQPDIDAVTVADVQSIQAQIADNADFDLLILDDNLPGLDASNALDAVLGPPPQPRVALICDVITRDSARRAFTMGIQGMLPKSMSAPSLLNAIRFICMGERFIPIDVLNIAAQNRIGSALSARERHVLQALCNGQTNKEIARELHLSEATVKLHMKTLSRRLGVNNRTQAALIARDMGLC